MFFASKYPYDCKTPLIVIICVQNGISKHKQVEIRGYSSS
jgi:hypothetical protein